MFRDQRQPSVSVYLNLHEKKKKDNKLVNPSNFGE